MGSHLGRTDTGTMQDRADKSCGKNAEQNIEQHAPTVCQLDYEPLAQLATEASIRIGPYTLTFELAQRIAQDPRNTELSPAIAELKSRSGTLHSEPSLALYDFNLQLLDDYLILLNQS